MPNYSITTSHLIKTDSFWVPNPSAAGDGGSYLALGTCGFPLLPLASVGAVSTCPAFESASSLEVAFRSLASGGRGFLGTCGDVD